MNAFSHASKQEILTSLGTSTKSVLRLNTLKLFFLQLQKTDLEPNGHTEEKPTLTFILVTQKSTNQARVF